MLFGGLWLLGEALWLRVAQKSSGRGAADGADPAGALASVFVRSLLICGWAVVLSLLLLRMQLVSPDLWRCCRGLAVFGAAACRGAGAGAVAHGSARGVGHDPKRTVRRAGGVVSAAASAAVRGRLCWLDLRRAQLFALIFWCSSCGFPGMTGCFPRLCTRAGGGEWLWLISSIALCRALKSR